MTLIKNPPWHRNMTFQEAKPTLRIYQNRIIVLSHNLKWYTKVLKFKDSILQQIKPEEITMKLQSALLKVL